MVFSVVRWDGRGVAGFILGTDGYPDVSRT